MSYEAQRSSLSIVLLIRNLGARCTPAALRLEESPVSTCREDCVGSVAGPGG
jgi:hypothetical protein